MPTTITVVPYRTIQNIRLTIGAITGVQSAQELDCIERRDNPGFGRREIDLTQCLPWERIRLDVTVEIDEQELLGALGPIGASALRKTVVLGTLSCGQTKLRSAIALALARAGRWEGSFAVDRSDVLGELIIGTRVVRAEDRDPPIDGIATSQGAILGEGEPVHVLVDEFVRPYDGPVKFQWADFGASDNELLKRNAARFMLVDTSDVPTAYLNSGIESFQAALGSTARRGPAAVARDALSVAIGEILWFQLSLAAVASIAPGDEEAMSVPSDWRGPLARAVADFANPDTPPDEALKQVYDSRSDGELSNALFTSIGLFAQDRSQAKRRIERALRAAAEES